MVYVSMNYFSKSISPVKVPIHHYIFFSFFSLSLKNVLCRCWQLDIAVIIVDREVPHSIVPTHPLENGMFIYLLDGIF